MENLKELVLERLQEFVGEKMEEFRARAIEEIGYLFTGDVVVTCNMQNVPYTSTTSRWQIYGDTESVIVDITLDADNTIIQID